MDVIDLLLGNIIRIGVFECKWISPLCHEIYGFLLVVSVAFDQIPVVGNIEPIGSDFHMFTQQIITHISSVEEELNELHPGSPIHIEHFAQLEGDTGSQQRLVAVVCQQDPLFIRGHI